MRRAVVVALLLSFAVLSPAAAGAKVRARGSVEQVQVDGARSGTTLRLLDRRGRTVASQRAGKLGGAVFRGIRPGAGYRLRVGAHGTLPAFRVLSRRSAPPSTALYRQKIPKTGYGYLTTRDGTKLAIDVHLPGAPAKAPYPTLVEYSGYGYANPNGPESSISQIATLLGFAVVDVNMRGTGWSGGPVDSFERLFGRVVRLLRAAADSRRLRRDRDRAAPAVGGAPQGGDDGRLLRRHQPAVRGGDEPAKPGRHHPAVGDRQLGHHAVSGQHPQHRLRADLGAGPRARLEAGV